LVMNRSPVSSAAGWPWAHVIGDIPSAAACFRTWAQLVSGKEPPYPTLHQDPSGVPPSSPGSSAKAPPSVMATAAPVGDHWAVTEAGHDMAPFSFHVTEQQLEGLLRLGVAEGDSRRVGPFELVSALMWRALAVVRGPGEAEATRTVTVVKAGAGAGGLSNEHRIGHVAAPVAPAQAGVATLAALLTGARLDEAVAAAGAGDVVVYGANLTFVDAGDVDVYGGMELAGRRPAHVEYAVGGGAAVVHRDAGGRGRAVAASVRREEADRLREAIRDALRCALLDGVR
jgi:hypothetical protein